MTIKFENYVNPILCFWLFYSTPTTKLGAFKLNFELNLLHSNVDSYVF